MSAPAYQPRDIAGLHLRLTSDVLAVARLEPGGPLPAWAHEAPGFLSISRSADELSVICARERVPAGVRHEAPFRLLQAAGPLPFDAVGIMAALSGTLASAGVSLVPVGTFDTDYLLVRESDVERSVAALTAAGCAVDRLDGLAGPDAAAAAARGDALRESERRFRLMADAAPVLVWTAGPDGRRTFVNRRWLTFSGRPLEAELGWGWLDTIHPDDVARARRTYESAFDSRQGFRVEYRLRRHDGQQRWVLDDGAPLTDDDGTFQGYVGSCVDVTGRRQTEELREQLLAHERRARGEAERLSRLKDEFLGTLSHELRTPLNAILGWTQVLRRSASASVTPAGLDIIDRNARALAQLVDDLLDISRIVAGDLRLTMQPVVLHQVIDAAIESLRAAADARGVEIGSNVSASLPALQADPARLQQVAWNLVSNAVKFTPAGGRVTVSASEVTDAIVLDVSDTGRGIAPEFLPQVFDRFSQADGSASRMHGGLGLGLAIVRHLVELHGGTVEVDSPGIGRGTRFRVTLPARGVARHAER